MSNVYVNTRGIIRRRRDGQVAQQGVNSYRSPGYSGGDVNYETVISLLGDLFEVVGEAPNQYLRIKLPVASDGNIRAHSDTGWLPPTIWESMPKATAASVGGIQLSGNVGDVLHGDGTWSPASGGSAYTFQNSLVDQSGVVALVNDTASPGISKMYGTNGSGVRGWYNVPSSMVYPGVGLVVSAGSTWGTSITPSTGYLRYTGSAWEWKNETYSLSSHTHTFASLTSKPTTLIGYGITDAEAAISKSTGYLRWTGSAWEWKNETYSLSSHTHTFVSLTSKPTTLNGYGITDAAPISNPHFSGKVGIGVSTPGASLHVVGAIAVTTNDEHHGKALIYTQDGSYVYEGDLIFAPEYFNGTEYSGGTERLRIIAHTGNVAIGRTTASSRLHVAGDIRATGNIIAHSS